MLSDGSGCVEGAGDGGPVVGVPGALAVSVHVLAEVMWFGEMVQLVGALRRGAEAKWVLVRGFCSLHGRSEAKWVLLRGFCALRGWNEAI